MICSQGTPNSINKLFTNMASIHRVYIMQHVQPNHNNFQNPVKQIIPQSRKKKNSPTKQHVVGKWEKQVMGIKTPTTGEKDSPKARDDTTFGSFEHSCSFTLKEKLNYLPQMLIHMPLN